MHMCLIGQVHPDAFQVVPPLPKCFVWAEINSVDFGNVRVALVKNKNLMIFSPLSFTSYFLKRFDPTHTHLFTLAPGPSSCWPLWTTLMTSGRERRDYKQTLSDSLANLWVYGAGWRGYKGGEGGSPAPHSTPHRLLTSALTAWLTTRVLISAGGSAASRRRGGSNLTAKEKNEVQFLLGEKKNYGPASHFYCWGRDQAALCYGWAFGLVLSSRLRQRGDDGFLDRGNKVMWLSATLYREPKLSVNLSLSGAAVVRGCSPSRCRIQLTDSQGRASHNAFSLMSFVLFTPDPLAIYYRTECLHPVGMLAVAFKRSQAVTNAVIHYKALWKTLFWNFERSQEHVFRRGGRMATCTLACRGDHTGVPWLRRQCVHLKRDLWVWSSLFCTRFTHLSLH